MGREGEGWGEWWGKEGGVGVERRVWMHG